MDPQNKPIGGPLASNSITPKLFFFLTRKGLRQGDPSSPLLFILVVDVLTRMLIKVASEDLIRGMWHDVCPRGIISQQYVDDTIIL